MGPQAPGAPLPQADALCADLLASLLDADQPRAMAVLDRAAILGWTIDDVRAALITPAMIEVGARWEGDHIGVAEEHVACSICEWLLFTLAGRAHRTPATDRRALVGCSEGELHCLGARIVGHLLTEHGWRVLYLGAATPARAWSQIVEARRPDVVVLCTTMRDRLEPVLPTLEAIKTTRPGCRTVVGGQAYWGAPEPPAARAADLVALEVRDLPGRLAG